MATARPAPDNAVAPTERQLQVENSSAAIQNVHKLAADYGDFQPRRPRLRLDPDAYRKLRTEVLERDGRRCQYCGSSDRLEVHHMCSRSRLGDALIKPFDGASNRLCQPFWELS
jgi:hypothetical protein